jgi:oxygen-independent coproporphyrinogen-3 oxidase
MDIRTSLPVGTPLKSVFIGGGTPSLLSLAQMQSIVAALREVASFDVELEFSLEVNPATTSPEWLSGLYVLGVNRLSIGVQSFQDDALQLLGRAHTGSEALACVENARSAGFENINIDMMFALPGLNTQARNHAWMKQDQDLVAHLKPEHVSVYGMTLEPGTPFGEQVECGLLTDVDEEDFRVQFLDWHHTLEKLGFVHYEISNYALAGSECQHNLAYWKRNTCYACGAGAHAFDSNVWGIRSACASDVSGYIEALRRGENPRREVERFDVDSAMAEWVYLRLRTARGVDEREFRGIFGKDFSHTYADAIRTCGAALRCEAGRWYLTPRGWLLYNHYVQAFLS